MINQNWIYIGVALQAFGGLSYLIDTIKGKIQPNKVSWLLWTMAPLIAFFAMVKQGVGPEAWATFIAGFIPLLVFTASFVNKKAYWEITRLDVVCGALSVLGLILWLITKVGNIAILFSIVADALASIPTVIKSYKEPESESDSVYLFGIVNSGIALLIIKDWNFQNWGFPAYLLFIGGLLTLLIRFKIGPKLQKK